MTAQHDTPTDSAGELAQLRQRIMHLEAENTHFQQRVIELDTALTQAQQQIERLRMITDTTTDWAWEVDANGVYTYVSPNIVNILGYTPDDVLGKTPFDFMPPEEAAHVGAIFGPIAAAQAPIQLLENAAIHKDGSRIVQETSGMPFYDTNGVFCGYRGVDRDITRRKATEAELRQSQAMLRTIIATLPQAICWKDRHLVYQGCNQAFAAVVGVATPEQIVGKSDEELPWKPEAADFFRQVDQRVLTSASAEHNIVTLPVQTDGQHAWLNIRSIPLYDEDGQVSGILGACEDITERKQAEEDLLMGKYALDHAFDAIEWIDHTGRFFYVNETDCHQLGYTRAELLTMGVADIDPNFPVAAWDALWSQTKQVNSIRFETLHQRKDGSIFPVEVAATYMQAAGKEWILSIARDITDRKEAEMERDQLFTLSPDMMCIAGFDGYFKRLNPSWSRVLGWSDEELYAEPFLAFVHPDDRQPTIDAAQNLSEGQTVISFTNRYRCKDGTYRWIEWVSSPVTEQQCIYAVARDVSERKQMEAKLEASQQFLRLIIDHIPQAIFWKSRDLTYLGCNRYFAWAAGLASPDEIVGKSDFELSWADLAELYRADDSQVMETDTAKIAFEEPHVDVEGVTKWVRTSKIPLHTGQGDVFAVLGLFEDITARKQQEAELRIFEMMVTHAPNAMGYAWPDGTIVSVNDAYRALTGYADPVGMSFGDHFSEAHREAAMDMFTSALTRGVVHTTLVFQRPDGSLLNVDSSGVLVRDANDQPQCVVGIFRDLTEQQRAEAEREALQQQVIEAQRATLRELSTPFIPITDTVVIMPLIGTIDSQRAQQIMEALLDGVAQQQAELVILDITGVALVDTQVAQTIIQAAQAVRLLGARVMLTGIQPQMAQTLVHLGVDLSDISTRGTLQAGIAAALRGRNGL